jgi:hypothetical protein
MGMNEARNGAVFAKAETGSALTRVAADVIEINGTDAAGVVSPDLSFVEVSVLRPDFDKRPGTPGRAKSNVSISSYLTVPEGGSTTAPTPRNGVLLYGAGLKETLTSSQGSDNDISTWTPIAATDSEQSIQVWAETDGIVTTATGVQGGVSINLQAGQYPTVSFTGEGVYVAPANSAATAPSYPTEVLHQAASAGFSFNSIPSTNFVTRSFSLDWSTSQAERLDLNSANGYAGTVVTDRVGRMSATIEFQDSITTVNPEALLLAGNTMAVSLELGDFAANTAGKDGIEISAAAAQITNVSRSVDSGVMVASIDWLLTGATPFSIAFKTAEED